MNIKISILILLLVMLACQTTTEPFVTYPPDETPTAGVAETSEPAAGEVFEIDNLKSTITDQRCATVTAIESLHLRAGPSEKSKVIAYLHNGEQVTILNSAGSWWKIETSSAEGWSNAEYLKESSCHD